ncbi:hypothetical protein KSP40_PGU018358 [Platanthera guangdongensis]|uniref:Uncharacterized protein n=1 Tax=Platanthera guangdongensis TaxID=2320717 RepID=A0ABR2MIC5_9ASPA
MWVVRGVLSDFVAERIGGRITTLFLYCWRPIATIYQPLAPFCRQSVKQPIILTIVADEDRSPIRVRGWAVQEMHCTVQCARSNRCEGISARAEMRARFDLSRTALRSVR